ncbi:MAG: hypothetical protein OEV49_10490 [candidate division Zixibacteria bacterium]|nr:hypothetical protein [candidate division Zixibacteria bacterium]MDH3936339.1 hypothetical protein [candidate division Zixibacteria bacterium]MDH4035177.1 hypothetical protein [candidate division Zixibacteria bacterium]
MRMRLIWAILVFLFVASGPAYADQHFTLDSNTAFFEGVNLAYVFNPPPNMKLITEEANDDGYSFAFIAETDEYKDAGALVGVTIFTLGTNAFDSVVTADTAAIREHYGGMLTITPVDSVTAFDGSLLPTFYIDDDTRFIPTVMVSYFDGGSEIVLFELSISANGLPRFLAEGLFSSCIQHFKALVKGELETSEAGP